MRSLRIIQILLVLLVIGVITAHRGRNSTNWNRTNWHERNREEGGIGTHNHWDQERNKYSPSTGPDQVVPRPDFMRPGGSHSGANIVRPGPAGPRDKPSMIRPDPRSQHGPQGPHDSNTHPYGPRKGPREQEECKFSEIRISGSCFSRAKWEFFILSISILAIAFSICLIVCVVVVVLKVINRFYFRRNWRQRQLQCHPCNNSVNNVPNVPTSINSNEEDYVNINNINSIPTHDTTVTPTQTTQNNLRPEVTYPQFKNLATAGNGDFSRRDRNTQTNLRFRENSPKSNYHLLK